MVSLQFVFYLEVLLLALLFLSYYINQKYLALMSGIFFGSLGVYIYSGAVSSLTGLLQDIFVVLNLGISFFFISTILISIIEKSFNISIGGFANDDDEDW